ncbi:hypothetical protein C8255_15340 [filamentous cyanobacterium CCP3]|nr:hypothetical protein C8255_15340 [filamentous cyanobacterium CCP3]
MKDFFVSYNSADKTWAEWIAWVLEEHGYTVVIQAWDFRPGGNFILDMQRAAEESHRTIMVLSEDYLKAKYTQPEWAAAFKQDPTAEERRLIPIRVAKCKPTGMLAPLVYVDLVDKAEAEAEALVLAALQARAKPATRPSFPGGTPTKERVVQKKAAFPQSKRVTWQIVLDYTLQNTFDHFRKIDSVVAELKQLSDDKRLEEVGKTGESGSTVVTLKGTEAGFSIIESLSNTGQLPEICGLLVEQVRLVSNLGEFAPAPAPLPSKPASPAMTPPKTELTPKERLALSRQITGLTVQEFNDLLLLLEPPAGLIPPPSTSQGDRTFALLSWAQSTTGCGLAAVQAALQDILP